MVMGRSYSTCWMHLGSDKTPFFNSWNHGHEQHEVLFVEHFSMLKWFLDMFLMECAKSYDFSTGCLVFVFFPHDCFSPHLVTFQRFPNIGKKRRLRVWQGTCWCEFGFQKWCYTIIFGCRLGKDRMFDTFAWCSRQGNSAEQTSGVSFRGFHEFPIFGGIKQCLKCMVNWREFPLYNFRCLVWVGNVRTSGWKLNLHGVHPRKLTAGIWKNWKNTYEKASTNTAIRWGFILLFRDVRIPHLSLYIPWTLVKRFLTTRCKVDHF